MPSMLLSLRSKPKCDHSLDYSPSAANRSTEEFFYLQCGFHQDLDSDHVFSSRICNSQPSVSQTRQSVPIIRRGCPRAPVNHEKKVTRLKWLERAAGKTRFSKCLYTMSSTFSFTVLLMIYSCMVSFIRW
jgi:hypothetical protein